MNSSRNKLIWFVWTRWQQRHLLAAGYKRLCALCSLNATSLDIWYCVTILDELHFKIENIFEGLSTREHLHFRQAANYKALIGSVQFVVAAARPVTVTR